MGRRGTCLGCGRKKRARYLLCWRCMGYSSRTHVPRFRVNAEHGTLFIVQENVLDGVGLADWRTRAVYSEYSRAVIGLAKFRA